LALPSGLINLAMPSLDARKAKPSLKAFLKKKLTIKID